MALNVKYDSEQAAENGIAAGPAGAVMVTAEITLANSIPAAGDGLTLKNAVSNIVGDEFVIANDSGAGIPGPLNVFASGGATINGVPGPFVIAGWAPAPLITYTFKCLSPGQWWITAIA